MDESRDLDTALNFVRSAAKEMRMFEGSPRSERTYVLSLPEKTYLATKEKVFFSSVEVKQGSIVLIGTISVTFLLAVYNGVANYPNFKLGLQEIQDDVEELVRQGSLLQLRRYRRYLERRRGSKLMEPNRRPFPELGYEKVSEQDVLDILEKAVQDNKRI